ncbi:MAG: hypothetical protein ACRCRW_09805, partial [Aeromonadaceae bacterium]
KDLERQYRKNLMVAASIVLIYSIAGGQMSSDLSMLGAKLKFSRPEWLEYAMLSIMIFFWWRHWQISHDIRDNITQIVFEKCRLSCASIRYAINDKVKSPFSVISVSLARNPSAYLISLSENSSVYSEVRLNSLHPIVIDFGSLNTYFNCDERQLFEYPLRAKLYVSLDYFRAYVVCAIKFPDFGDGVLPNLISLVSCIAYIASKLVQS